MRIGVFKKGVANIAIVLMLTLFGLLTAGGGSVAVLGGKDNAVIYRGDASQPNMALMINVYWGSEYLPSMLETLADRGVCCTFFIGGTWAAKEGALLERIVAGGHELGNHGYNHRSPTKISDALNREEITVTERLIESLTGVRTTLFAPPSGDVNKHVATLAAELGYRTVMWSQDTIDWRDKDADVIYRRATERAANGNLVLMHPTQATALALPKIIDRLRALGYNLTTVSRTLAENA